MPQIMIYFYLILGLAFRLFEFLWFETVYVGTLSQSYQSHTTASLSLSFIYIFRYVLDTHQCSIKLVCVSIDIRHVLTFPRVKYHYLIHNDNNIAKILATLGNVPCFQGFDDAYEYKNSMEDLQDLLSCYDMTDICANVFICKVQA